MTREYYQAIIYQNKLFADLLQCGSLYQELIHYEHMIEQ